MALKIEKKISLRQKTSAHRRFVDDVPQDIKIRRLQDLAKVYRQGADELNANCIGKNQLILVEGVSKSSYQNNTIKKRIQIVIFLFSFCCKCLAK